MEKTLVTGTLGYDYIMDFPGCFADRIMPDKIHKISLSFLVDKLTKQFGGTAGNIAYNLKLLGIDPLLLSAAGHDFEPYKTFLEKVGVSCDSVVIVRKETTGSYFVVTDREDNQIGSFYSGANKFAHSLSIADTVRQNPVNFAVCAPTDPKAMALYVKDYSTLNIPYLYDPAFQIGSIPEDDLRCGVSNCQILIGNDYEISLIENKLGIPHEELLTMCPITITTLGSIGSVIETRNESIHIKPAKAKNVSDPTGAGDAYRAGFLAGYLRKFDLPTCGCMGSVASVYTVEKYGTMTHSYTINEFTERFRLNYGTDLVLE